ncbi:MAG: YHS domain-containing protein [Planctomycetaceae bacterium]
MSRWNMWRWNRNSIRAWVTCAFSGAALATLSGVMVELRAENASGESTDDREVGRPLLPTETRISRDGEPVSRTLRPLTPRRKYETAEDIRARAAKLKNHLDRGRSTTPETVQSVTTTTYRSPASAYTPTVAGSRGSVPVIQVQDRRIVESDGTESSEPTAVQRKLQELYDRDNLQAPPMTLKELKRQDGRRFLQRAPKIDSGEEKPSLVQRLNPFSRFSGDGDRASDAAAPSQTTAERDLAPPPGPEPESKMRKLTKHYRRPKQGQTAAPQHAATIVPAPRQAPARKDVKQQVSTERASARKTSKSHVDARPAVSKQTSRNERKPSGELPVIVPQEDPTFSQSKASVELPTVVPERNDEFDLELPLPTDPAAETEIESNSAALEGSGDDPAPLQDQFTDESESEADAPRKLSKLDPAKADHKLTQIPAEIDPATEAKMQQIAARGAASGLKGFCPVALKNDRELKDARAEFNSIYQGVVYGFCSQEAKQEFDSDPEKFVPAVQGHDVVLKVSDVNAPGSLDYAVWYKNRLFLFSSPETMQEFSASPNDYTK